MPQSCSYMPSKLYLKRGREQKSASLIPLKSEERSSAESDAQIDDIFPLLQVKLIHLFLQGSTFSAIYFENHR